MFNTRFVLCDCVGTFSFHISPFKDLPFLFFFNLFLPRNDVKLLHVSLVERRLMNFIHWTFKIRAAAQANTRIYYAKQRRKNNKHNKEMLIVDCSAFSLIKQPLNRHLHNSIIKKNIIDSNYRVVRDIKRLLNGRWEVKFVHI